MICDCPAHEAAWAGCPLAGLFATVLSAIVFSTGCGGSSVQGAKPWLPRTADEAQFVAEYELTRCSDVLGQALPLVKDRLTLYRTGDRLRLLTEPQGLTPLMIDNTLHADKGNTFQVIVDDQLLEIRLPTAKRAGQWLVASHWEEWQQQEGFGARPTRVVERCEVTLHH